MWPKLGSIVGGSLTDPERERCEYGFGRLIDLVRTKPIAVAKYGTPVVVVLAREEYERLKALDVGADREVGQEAKKRE